MSDLLRFQDGDFCPERFHLISFILEQLDGKSSPVLSALWGEKIRWSTITPTPPGVSSLDQTLADEGLDTKIDLPNAHTQGGGQVALGILWMLRNNPEQLVALGIVKLHNLLTK
jgi:hypothetical protein